MIAPRAAELDHSGEFPWDNVRDINALGLNMMFVPEAYGGMPLSYLCYLACVREISKACASTGIVWATNFHAVKPLIEFGSEEQKARLLPRIADGGLAALAITEPDAGSDATGMKTTLREDGDAIVVDGGKTRYYRGPKIVPADVLTDGRQFHDIDGLKQLLLADQDQLARGLAGKLLTYATGRAPDVADALQMDAMVAAVRSKNYGTRALVHEVVQSEVFQTK